MRGFIHAMAMLVLLSGPAGAQDPVIGYPPDNRRMSAAIAAAQASLDLFMAHALGPDGASCDGCMVKVALPTRGGPPDEEHVWVEPFAQLADGCFAGLLANEPHHLRDLHHLDEVEFGHDAILDWLVRAPGGRYHAAFTLRVMHADGGFGATPFEEVLEPDPLPKGWR